MGRVVMRAASVALAAALGLPASTSVTAPTPASAAPALARPDTTPALVSLYGRRLAVRSGRTQVMLGCPSTEISCAIRITLRGSTQRVLGLREGSVAGDSLAVFQIRLRPGVVAQVRQARLLPAVLTASVTDAAGNHSKRSWSVRLKIAKPPRWQDDPVQLDDPDFEGGANIKSLNQARARWAKQSAPRR